MTILAALAGEESPSSPTSWSALLATTALVAASSTAAAQDATWTGTTSEWTTSTNWSTGSLPTGTATFVDTGSTTVSNTGGSVTLGEILFTPSAQAYTFTIDNAFTLNGAGVVNNSTNAQTFNVSAGQTLTFQNSASASGGTGAATNISSASGIVNFNDSSTAVNANIGIGNQLNFNNSSSAGSAVIGSTGTINFNNSATASTAQIYVVGGQLTFNDTSTAASAQIVNFDHTTFNQSASAGNASITNYHDVIFNGTSTAGNATIVNYDSTGGGLYFNNTSTAGSAQITNSGGILIFNDTSTAGSATVTNNYYLYFNNASTAGNAAITNNSHLYFFGASTAGSAAITNNSYLYFYNTSTAGNAAITNDAGGKLDFSGSTGPLGDHKLTAGSIAGAGEVYLGLNELTVGGNNLSTTVSGVISACGATGWDCTAWLGTTTGGSLVKIGTGMLTLSGVNTYGGGTTVNGGLINFNTASSFGSGTITLNGGGLQWASGTSTDISSRLTAIGSNGATFDTNGNNVSFGTGLSGAGGVTKTGDGTLTFLAANTYAGGTTINGGTLEVDGSIASSSGVFVNSGGTLTGTGSVGATQVNAGGIFAPGDGTPGTSMTVMGNLAFQSGALYLVQVNPSTASFTTVTGTATLGGATVSAVFASGSQISKQYKILTATGGVSGTFGSLVDTNLPTNFRATLSYDANDAYLTLILNFASPGGLNGNQQAVANGLINFFNSNGIPLLYSTLSAGGLTQAAGESASGSQQTTFQAMSQFMGVLTDPFAGRGSGSGGATSPTGYAEEDDQASAYAERRTTDAFAMFTKAPSVPFAQRWSVWAAGFGGSQSTSGNALVGSNDTTSRIAGTAVGADYLFSPNTLAGFALAGGGTSFGVNGMGSGRSDLFQAGAYIRHTDGPAYVTGALAYGWQDITTNRTVSIVGLDQLRAEFNANAYSGRVEGGYRFVAPVIGGVGITPYAAGQFTTFDLPAYAESVVSGTSNFVLNYAAKSVTDARSELGIRTDKSFAMFNGELTLRSRLAWAYDFNPDRSIGATFQALPGASFVVNGAAQAHDSALTTASVEMKWRTGWSAIATFEGEFSNVTSSYAGKGVVRYAW
ncbi:autotransporter domain-containing protein [Bradyrhizobium sp. UFLA05-109]